MGKLNSNLSAAKKAKNDEFYTQLTDIEKELYHYRTQFKGKVVFCNCDDPSWSNFFKYFLLNFKFLGLKKLITTHYETDKPSYKIEVTLDSNGKLQENETPLKENGDFRSQECIDILKESDIVVTNPPFSLFREFIATLVEHGKQFLVIGNMNAITYKEIFPLIKENKLWLGCMKPKTFIKPDGEEQHFGNILWFTNMQHSKRNEELILFRKYNEKDYPKYDNYDAIEVSKVCNIPVDYQGVMGVPITFLDKYNPEQFEIVGLDRMVTTDKKRCFINGKEIYARILIKRK